MILGSKVLKSLRFITWRSRFLLQSGRSLLELALQSSYLPQQKKPVAEFAKAACCRFERLL
jgi:hypothetical protein